MAILKCKNCGGDVIAKEGELIGICEYCGSTMTLPKIEDEQRIALYNRGNHFRMRGEYDRALTVFEQILALDTTDAEAHWNVALCRFGIEYVEDPDSHKHIPTCHRASWDSILTDVDYLAALQYADSSAKEIYEAEAAYIDNVQKGILAISKSEAPYDIFICYKETTDGGSRTKDSVYAQDLYARLTKEGYRVFFARITLESKLGQQYEPYIFAALNSAKVMLVIGTDPDNFNAPWVRNEWGRYLNLLKKDSSRLLIPCFRDMDAYELPDELAIFQSQDMSKIGFEQDLLHGIQKIIRKKPGAEGGNYASRKIPAADVSALLRRAKLFMEESNWDAANQYFDRALDLYPECTDAYIGKLCIEFKCVELNQVIPVCSERIEQRVDDMHTQTLLVPLSCRPNYIKALRFANDETGSMLKSYDQEVLNLLHQGTNKKVDKLSALISDSDCNIAQMQAELEKNNTEKAQSQKETEKLLSEQQTLKYNTKVAPSTLFGKVMGVGAGIGCLLIGCTLFDVLKMGRIPVLSSIFALCLGIVFPILCGKRVSAKISEPKLNKYNWDKKQIVVLDEKIAQEAKKRERLDGAISTIMAQISKLKKEKCEFEEMRKKYLLELQSTSQPDGGI